jgi:hypothetical protein
MKTILFALSTVLLFTSCLVVKIYESPKLNQETAEKTSEYRSYIGSGKVITLKENQPREIFFIGNVESPKGLFFADKKEDTRDTVRSPLLIVDGKINEDFNTVNSIDPDTIESVNVLKGEQALKKYGEKGRNGVIEITLKK